jgi:hypothetical protein
MKSLIAVALFGFLAFGAAAQTPTPKPVTPKQETPTPAPKPTQAEIDAWNNAVFKYNAEVNALNARINELKHAAGIDLLEEDNAIVGARLKATIPAGYHFDPNTQKLAENPPDPPKVDAKNPQSGQPAGKKQ